LEFLPAFAGRFDDGRFGCLPADFLVALLPLLFARLVPEVAVLERDVAREERLAPGF